jgi:hypothetical protein
MDTNLKLNAAEELNINELDAVAGGRWFSSMDVDSKITPVAVLLTPYGGIYTAAAVAYDAFVK